MGGGGHEFLWRGGGEAQLVALIVGMGLVVQIHGCEKSEQLFNEWSQLHAGTTQNMEHLGCECDRVTAASIQRSGSNSQRHGAPTLQRFAPPSGSCSESCDSNRDSFANAAADDVASQQLRVNVSGLQQSIDFQDALGIRLAANANGQLEPNPETGTCDGEREDCCQRGGDYSPRSTASRSHKRKVNIE